MQRVYGETKYYELKNNVGEGRTGSVYKAIRYSLAGKSQDIVAIKILKTENPFLELVKEFEVVRSINSKYVAKFFTLEEVEGQTAIVMEYIDGITLDCLQRLSPSPRLGKYIWQELEKALKDLEEQKIFHGDFAPQNIMISAKGEIKLIDFASHYNANYTKYGTSGYMPKEHLAGNHSGIYTDFAALKLIFQLTEVKDNVCFAEIQQELQSLFLYTRSRQAKTTALAKKKQFVHMAYAMTLATICFFISIPQNAPLLTANQGPSYQIHIKSSSWVAVRIRGSGEDFQYSPATLYPKKQESIIEWKTAKGSGESKIYLDRHKQSYRFTEGKFINK